MSVRLLTTDDDLSHYDTWVRSHPHGSLWQSIVRKRYAEACGKETRVYVMDNGELIMDNEKPIASALVMIDRTTGGFSTCEIARGPLWTNDEAAEKLIERIINDAKKDRCIAIYLSPATPLPKLSIINYQLSIRHVHAAATRIIDLTQPEDAILAQMHQKGRYNINVAKRHGIRIEQGSVADIDILFPMLQETAKRDGFIVSQKSHYTRFLTNLEGSFILLAKHAQKPIRQAQGKPVAGLIGVMWQGTGFYYYGASSYENRNFMAPYLLQWEAMRKCKEQGCERYDLLGIEEGLGIRDPGLGSSHPWAGISEFKRKFGGTITTYPPEQMIVLRPLMHRLIGLKRSLLG